MASYVMLYFDQWPLKTSKEVDTYYNIYYNMYYNICFMPVYNFSGVSAWWYAYWQKLQYTLQWNLSYLGSLVPTPVHILEVFVTKNCCSNWLEMLVGQSLKVTTVHFPEL